MLTKSITKVIARHRTNPDEMRLGRVVVVCKKGDTHYCANYRPISLLPIISKLLEKVVGKQLLDFLAANKIIHKHQYGFQPNKSTIHPMVHLLNEIGSAKKDKKVSIGIFMDISRAFDCISTPIMLKKLKKIGI